MIMCTRVESRGAFRSFSLDDSVPLNRAAVTTYLSLTPRATSGHEPFRQEAGEVHWTEGGVEASIAVTSGRGFSTNTDLVKLSGVFRNEVDALMAIAVGYDSDGRRGS